MEPQGSNWKLEGRTLRRITGQASQTSQVTKKDYTELKESKGT